MTEEYLEQQIVKVDYNRFGKVGVQCVLTLANGKTVTGQSSCIDPAMFDEEVGKKFAYGSALNKLRVSCKEKAE